MQFPGATHLVVLVRGSREQAEALKAEIAAFLKETLRLDLTDEKTLITHVDEGFDFLGFHIRRYHRNGRKAILATPSRKAQAKFRQRIRELTRDVAHHEGNLWIIDLNGYLAGWAEYFRRGNSKRIFSKLDNIVWWVIALRIRGRWRRSRVRKGFRRFMQEQLIPHRFDVQHPHNRRYRTKNFGHWVDSTKKAALIVDCLGHHPIHYAYCFTQIHPYTAEGRAKMEAQRRAGRLVNAAWRVVPPEKTNGPRVYSLLRGWLTRMGNRCSRYGKDLDKADVQGLLKRLARRLRNARTNPAPLYCRTCVDSPNH